MSETSENKNHEIEAQKMNKCLIKSHVSHSSCCVPFISFPDGPALFGLSEETSGKQKGLASLQAAASSYRRLLVLPEPECSSSFTDELR